MNLPLYKKHKDREERIKSALKAAKAVLTLDLYPAHKKELLSICIWKITEADGKLNTRYRSLNSLNLSESVKLQHEHIVEMKKLISRLINDNEDAEVVLKNAVTCVVTSDEHQILTEASRKNPELDGWQRYAEAGIRVFDLEEQKEIFFS